MIDWRIIFFYDKGLDPVFIKNLIHFLVSRGLEESAGPFSILAKNPERYISYDDKRVKKESIKSLADIIDIYLGYDLKNTSFSMTARCLGEADFSFNLSIYPEKENGCLIEFESDEYSTPENAYLAFVNLCKEVFERFDFVFGGFRGEPPDTVPRDADEFLKCSPRSLVFYSKPLVDRIGREKLLSAPAYNVEGLSNGGVMLLVCPIPWDCIDEVIKIDRYLGYRNDQ